MASRVRQNFKRLNMSESGEKTQYSLYPLKMCTDHRTEMYVKFAKVMLIFQGPVTEERRKAVADLATKFKYAGRVISEETYNKEASPSVSEQGLDDVYLYFKSRAKKACEEGYNLIIIDPSMTNLLQLKYYYFLAQKMQYVMLPYPPLFDSQAPDYKNTLAVKFGKFSERRVDRPNYFKHLFCGWFLHDVDSHELRGEASLYVQDCFDNIRDFKKFLTDICKAQDFREFYNMLDQRQDLAFCVTKIFQNPLDIKGYISNSTFMKYYGSMSKLYVVGFIVSPHTIAARIKLTREQKCLWDMPDYLDEKTPPTVFPTELLKSTKVSFSEEKVTLIASKSNRTIVSGEPIYNPTEVIHPKAKGRSCNIILGKVDKAPRLNADYDVPLAVQREGNVMQSSNSDDVKPYDLDRCLVRRIGKYWFIYLKETLIVNGFFASCCSVEVA